jgi:hypothetical protein
MKTLWTWLLLLALPVFLTWNLSWERGRLARSSTYAGETPALLEEEPKGEVAFPHFRMQEIETGLKVGYAVLIADINNDGKPDIVVVDSNRVVWYENPTWKRRTIIEGQTKPDNVCIAAYDIDGDGQIDLALGAGWKPFDTKEGGTIQWLKRGKTLDDPWTLHPIGEEPTVHRMCFADLDGKGMSLIVAPLMGRNSTAKNNWMDGSPVRILAFRIPKDPTKDRWEPEVISEGLHVVHNIHPVIREFGRTDSILAASYEGITELFSQNNHWSALHIGAGNQENPKSNRGSSEVRESWLMNQKGLIATIEPWHGNQVVIYTEPEDKNKQMWNRYVIDKQLKWGHAVEWADVDGDHNPEVIAGIRDNLSDKPGERRGVRIYKALDEKGTKWARHIVEDGGVAVEALAVADLNGDGRPDVVAAGRQTGNVRIYWNQGVKSK